jgi:prepilin-type N-terminal cleavage/methylation domain-containing protein
VRRTHLAPAGGRAGLTLIELMLVMGILAVVMGAGLGTLASMNPAQGAALGVVQDALRSAHNSAIARNAPARVRIDPTAGTIVAEAMLVAGTWHFESPNLEGADGLDGVSYGLDPLLTEDGWLGKALDFRGSLPGAEVEFAIQDDPIYDISGGFAIDLAIRPETLSGGRLLEIAGCLEVDLTRDGGVRMKVQRRSIDSTGRERKGAGLTVESEPGVLREKRWSQLRLQYDRRTARILVDGVDVGSTRSAFEVWQLEGSLRIGGGSTPIQCLVDELVVAVVAATDELALPGDVIFTKGSPTMVSFVAGGALDPTQHPGPVVIGIEYPDGRRYDVQVGLYGTVE